MDKQNLEKELRQQYSSGESIISDEQYDALFGTEETTLDEPAYNRTLHNHKVLMLSLPTVLTEDFNVFLPQNELYVVMPKYDGCSLSLEFENGKLVRILTRGKRYAGFEVHSKWFSLFKGVQLKGIDSCIIRGELMMTQHIWLNHFSDKYANARSAVQALLNSDNPRLEDIQSLHFIAHRIYEIYKDNKRIDSSYHVLDLQTYTEGLKIASYNIFNEKPLQLELKRYYEKYVNKDVYAFDGIVVQHTISNEFPNDGRCHLDSTAIKLRNDSAFTATTKIIDIQWRMKSNGALIPHITYEPVEIDGTICKQCAGHSLQFIRSLGAGIGAIIDITKSGAVIPYLSKVHEVSSDFNFPENAIEPAGGDVNLWSKNSENVINRLRFVRGLHSLALENCGDTQFHELVDAGYNSIFDLVEIRDEGFEALSKRGFKDNITYRNLAFRIQERMKTLTYCQFLLGYNIPGLGFKYAVAIEQMLLNPDDMALHAKFAGKRIIQNVLNDSELLAKMKEMCFLEKVKIEEMPKFTEFVLCAGKPPVGNKTQWCIQNLKEGHCQTSDMNQATIVLRQESYMSGTVTKAIKANKRILLYDDYINTVF